MTTGRVGLALQICFGCAVVLVALTVYTGLSDAPGVLRGAENGKQFVVGIAQIAYTLAALATLVGLALRRSWSVPAAVVWAAGGTTAGTFASVAWDSSSGVPAALGALLGGGIATGLVVWCIARYLKAVAQ